MNLKALRIITPLIFIAIALRIVFFYLNVNHVYVSVLQSNLLFAIVVIISLVMVIFLRNILKLYNERSGIKTMFTVYFLLHLILYLSSLAITFVFNKFFWVKAANGLDLLVTIIVFWAVCTMRVAAIKPGFVLFGFAILVVAIVRSAFPLVVDTANMKAYFYADLLEILPLVTALIIFNRVQNDLIQSTTNLPA